MSAYLLAEALMTLATFAFGLWGSWVLHARLRNARSRWLLVSLALFTVYCLFSWVLAEPLLRIVESRAPWLSNMLAWSTATMVPALLGVCVSLSFLFAARSIGRDLLRSR